MRTNFRSLHEQVVLYWKRLNIALKRKTGLKSKIKLNLIVKYIVKTYNTNKLIVFRIIMISIDARLAVHRNKPFFTRVITDALDKHRERLISEGLTPIRFDVGDPTEQHPRINEALIEYLKQDPKHAYGHIAGECSYREAAGRHMASRFNVDSINYNGPIQDLELCALPGSSDGIFKTICFALGDGILLLPFPGYPAYYDDAYVAGYRDMKSSSDKKVFPYFVNPENDFMPDIEEIYNSLGTDKSKVKAILINYPSNPTGAIADLKYYEKLVDFARRNGISIISDAVYAELYTPGSEPPHSILEIKGAKDVAIEFHSQSKTHGITGLRMGWAAGKKSLIGWILHLIGSDNISSTPIFIQKAAEQLLNNDDGYSEKMRREYHLRRGVLREGLQSAGWKIVRDEGNVGSFYEWAQIPDGKTSLAYSLELIEKKGIAGIPGTLFSDEDLAPGSKKHGEGFMRFALLQTVDKTREAIRRLTTSY